MKILIFALLLFALGCSTGSKRRAGIEFALTEIQAGRPEQGRGQLEKLCREGSAAACALTGKKVELKKPVPILQSVTSSGQSRFVVMVPRGENLDYFVRSAQSLTRLLPEHFSRSSSSSAIDQIEAFSLDAKIAYELIVIGPDGLLWDRRAFRTLDINKNRGRFALASGALSAQVVRQRPDMVLLLGENMTPQTGKGATPDELWDRYVTTRESLALFKADPLVPTLAVWDDYAYGKNDGDRTYPFKGEAQDIFFTFFAQKKVAPGFAPGPGVSSWWTVFGANFALLDNRTFRSPNGLDLPDQTHFGETQEKWLGEKLSAAKEPIFLVSGDPFFAGEQPLESFESSHPKRFKAQLEEWKKTKVPLVFLSGDRRSSEMAKVPSEWLGYSTLALTSSAIGGAQNTYLLIEVIRSARNFLQLDVQTFGRGEKQISQKTLTVKH